MNLHRFQGLIRGMDGRLASKAMNVLKAWMPVLHCLLSFISFSRPPHTRIYLLSILTRPTVRGPCPKVSPFALTHPMGWGFSVSRFLVNRKFKINLKSNHLESWGSKINDTPSQENGMEKRKKWIREEEGGNWGRRRNRTLFYLVTNPSLGSVGVLFSVFCPSD